MIVIPKRSKGRPSVAGAAAYQEQVERFCSQIEQIRATLDFEISARGWCYILEEHGATKADFPAIERLLVDCRKSGDLPLNICAEDEARAADHVEDVTDESPEEFVHNWIDRFGLNFDFIKRQRLSWTNNLITSSGEDLANPKHNDHHKPYVQDYIRKFDVRKVEANALVVRPEAGRRLCLNAIRRYIPDDLLSDFETRREVARQEARTAVERLLAQ